MIFVKMSTHQDIKFLLFLFICMYFCVGPRGSLANTSHCEFYNSTLCKDPKKQNCVESQVCELPDHGKRNHCFVLWQYNENNQTTTVKMKGCFLDNRDCYDQDKCVEKRHKTNPGKDLYFCCCQGDMCNRHYTWEPQLAPVTVLTPQQNSPKLMVQPATDQAVTTLLMCTIVPVLVIAVGISLLYWIYRQKKLAYFNEIPTMDLHCQSGMPPSPVLELRPIQLVEIKARGRFGAVWKAQYKSDTVAVKIFPVQDKQSWVSEQEIFKLPHMDHANILAYVGVEKRGDNLQAEFWLITAYHERGSLCDYLKANTVTWPECCLIVETMARGLMHLHEEVQPNKADGYKPAIAHRDFKSKNVLLKWDLSACIADFGLALIFQPGTTCGDTHGQVGTRRYMAPEVLEGAITFSRDAFLRIDMYAFGLVLWEIGSRCTAGVVEEYQPPFQAEVSDHPTLEDIQACVVDRKQRPIITDSWRKHLGMCVLCDTMEECWDHDAEARLSASCVVERVAYQCPRYKDIANT